MVFSRVPFDVVKKEIGKIFPSASLYDWNLLPEDINLLAESLGVELQWNPINWWTSFEQGEIEVSEDNFFHALFKGFKPTNNKVLIVTDECFEARSAYSVNFEDLLNFSKSIYPNIHQMDFVQPLDYIFVFPSEKYLIVINHEGFLMHFKNG